jgi:hypothetical protein
MVVKDNHPILHKKLKAFFTGSCLFGAEFESALSTDLGHGRVETRQIRVSSDLPKGYTGFTEVSQVFCLTRKVIIKKTGVVREESVYGMTSLPASQADPKCLLELNRGHWHIENKSHWVRDVTFEEDRSQVRKGNIPQVMAALRNVCIGLMRVKGFKKIAATCRHFAAKPEDALQIIGISKTE